MSFDAELECLLPWIRQQARRYSRVREDAEDLAGDTVLKMLQAKDRYDGRDLRALCYVTMLRLYINRYHRKRVVGYLPGEMVESLCGVVSEPSDVLVRVHDVVGILRRARRMSVCIDCVIDYAHGFSYEEIGKRYGIPVGAVGQRIWRGRKLLSRLL